MTTETDLAVQESADLEDLVQVNLKNDPSYQRAMQLVRLAKEHPDRVKLDFKMDDTGSRDPERPTPRLRIGWTLVIGGIARPGIRTRKDLYIWDSWVRHELKRVGFDEPSAITNDMLGMIRVLDPYFESTT